MFVLEDLAARGRSLGHYCCPRFHVRGDLYMHSVITEAQCVSNEKFNETLSVDRGQGLRRIMKSPISSRSMGCFSLLHSMLTESSIIPSATAGPQNRDNTASTEAKRRHYRLMTRHRDPCLLSPQLCSLLCCLPSFSVLHDTCCK